jgi:hypothetical protein
MKTKNPIFNFNGLALRAGVLFVVVFLTQHSPVLARAQDDAVFARLQSYRAQLVSNENQIWKDVEMLRWQMREQKDQTDIANTQKRIDEKLRDIDRIHIDLNDISQRLM